MNPSLFVFFQAVFIASLYYSPTFNPILSSYLPPTITKALQSLHPSSNSLQSSSSSSSSSPDVSSSGHEVATRSLGKDWCLWNYSLEQLKEEKKWKQQQQNGEQQQQTKEEEEEREEEQGLKVYDISEISSDVFFKEHVILNKPALIKGAASGWSAVTKWKSDDYLIEKMGRTRVKIEQSDDNVFRYLDEGNNNWITFALFLKKLNQTQELNRRLEDETGRDIEEIKGVVKKQKKVYAAGISNIEPLLDDIKPFEFASSLSFHEMGMWMGNGGQVTPLHYDTAENIMGVISGKKIFTLFEPSMTPNLYPLYSKNQYYSSIDILEPDFDSFPKFSNAKALTVIIEPGDALFVPSYWWHHVQSFERNIAINFFYHPHSLLLHNILSTLKDCFPSTPEEYQKGFTSPCVC